MDFSHELNHVAGGDSSYESAEEIPEDFPDRLVTSSEELTVEVSPKKSTVVSNITIVVAVCLLLLLLSVAIAVWRRADDSMSAYDAQNITSADNTNVTSNLTQNILNNSVKVV